MATVSNHRMARRSYAELVEGIRFGRLVIEAGPYCKHPGQNRCCYSSCRCDCGNTHEVRCGNLRSGAVTPCGCKHLDRITEHNESRTPLYRTWERIIQRCHNPRHKKFGDYGGRGITVCEEWRASYQTFRDWSLLNDYREDLEIDRRDNDGPYSPNNCRWTTRHTQVRNTRQTRNLTAFGETKCMVDWLADPRCQVKSHALRYRLKRGWPIEVALITPPAELGFRYNGIPAF